MVETYNKTVNVEGQLMVLMANRYILPAAFELPDGRSRRASSAVKAAGGKSVEGKKALDAMIEADRRAASGGPTSSRRRSSTAATVRAEKHAQALPRRRRPGDGKRCAKRATRSKSIIPHETWPLATYREMLFIK